MSLIRKMKAHWKRSPGQSFVELSLTIPVLMLLMAGVIEVAFLYFSYMTAIDLTREAARFASTRDYEANSGTISPAFPEQACNDAVLDYYFDTACFFTDNKLNPSLPISSTDYADVAISVFSVENGNLVSKRFPEATGGVFSLYSTTFVSGTETTTIPNWRLDCKGRVVRDEPYFTIADVEAMLDPNADPTNPAKPWPSNKGFVMVEVYYCYHHVLGLPFLGWAIPDPMRMHAYTIMPAQEAIPTPTPITPNAP